MSKVRNISAHATSLWKLPYVLLSILSLPILIILSGSFSNGIVENEPPTKYDIQAQRDLPPDPTLPKYSSEELDLLAIFATIIKILYLLSVHCVENS